MRNLTLLADYYALTMMQALFSEGSKKQGVFEMFFRPSEIINYGVAAGLEDAAKFIQDIKIQPRRYRISARFEFIFGRFFCPISKVSILTEKSAPCPRGRLYFRASLF